MIARIAPYPQQLCEVPIPFSQKSLRLQEPTERRPTYVRGPSAPPFRSPSIKDDEPVQVTLEGNISKSEIMGGG